MATEGMENRGADTEWRSYRCPVCGHADGVSVPRGASLTIRCSHCHASLDVDATGSGERVSVRVLPETGADE